MKPDTFVHVSPRLAEFRRAKIASVVLPGKVLPWLFWPFGMQTKMDGWVAAKVAQIAAK